MSRKPHKPTDEQRKTVKAMVGFGTTLEDIATVIEIDRKTLSLHYAKEIARGAIDANAQVAQSLFQQATKGRNMTAAIWWTKTRMGWKEVVHLANEDADKPFAVAHTYRWADAATPVIDVEPEPADGDK